MAGPLRFFAGSGSAAAGAAGLRRERGWPRPGRRPARGGSRPAPDGRGQRDARWAATGSACRAALAGFFSRALLVLGAPSRGAGPPRPRPRPPAASRSASSSSSSSASSWARKAASSARASRRPSPGAAAYAAFCCSRKAAEGDARAAREHAGRSPGQRAQAQEGVLGAHDERGHAHRRHQDDRAHGGEEPLEEAREPRADGAARRVRPAGLVRQHEVREHRAAHGEQAQRQHLRPAPALAVAHEEDDGGVEPGRAAAGRRTMPSRPRRPLASRWPTGPTELWKPGPTRSRGSKVATASSVSSEPASRKTPDEGPLAGAPRLQLLLLQRLATRGDLLPGEDALVCPRLLGRHGVLPS